MAQNGIQAEVVYLHRINPMDEKGKGINPKVVYFPQNKPLSSRFIKENSQRSSKIFSERQHSNSCPLVVMP
ncbi:MAG: hypothetical protein ACPLTR_03100 [Thermacetogeniaceae bacterium]